MTTRAPISRAIASALAGTVAAWMVGGLVGCGSGSARGTAQVETGSSEAEVDLSPVVRGAEEGLEARLWAIEGRPGLLAAVLGEFGPPASADARQVARWKENGLRVVEVPLDRLDWVRAQLPTMGPINREWLGMLPEWVEVVKGPTLTRERPIRLDSGVVGLGPGRLRMMARCWAMPSAGLLNDQAGVGSVLQIELMPELRIPRQAHDESLGMLFEDTVSSGEPGARGIAFDRLVLACRSSGEHAIVIVAESADADWSEPAPGRPESELAAPTVFGPPAVVAPTLGDVLLTNLTAPEDSGDARMVIVLVPRVPERFGVLPRSR